MDSATELAFKLHELKVNLEIEHKDKLQRIRNDYELKIFHLRRKQDALEAQIFMYKNKLESREKLLSSNNETNIAPQNPLETISPENCTDFTQIYIKSEPEVHFTLDTPDCEPVPATVPGDCVQTIKSRPLSVTPEEFECVVCKQTFASLIELWQHIAVFSELQHLEDANWAINIRAYLTDAREYYCHESGCSWHSKSLTDFKQHILGHQSIHCKENCDHFGMEGCNYEHNCDMKVRLKCPEPGCQRSYALKQSLNRHFQGVHMNESPYKCECGKSFQNARGLSTHIVIHYDRFACHEEGCNKTFIDNNRLMVHLQNEHSKADIEECYNEQNIRLGAQFKCQNEGCTRQYSSHQYLNRHLKNCNSVDKSRDYKCRVPDCGKCYPSIETLNVHNQFDHLQRRPFKCKTPGCELSFASSGEHIQHTKIHQSGKKALYCSATDCFYMTYTKFELELHTDTVHGHEPPYTCNKNNCGKSFLSTSTYKKHAKSHINLCKHLCNECGATFSNIYYFKSHLRIHAGDRPFVCTISDCDKAFSSSQHLKNHCKTHTNTRPFICTIGDCNKAFRKKSDLIYHNDAHAGNKPFSCTYSGCTLSFRSASMLRRHKKVVHLNIRPFVCPSEYCGKKFAHSYQLKEHSKQHNLNK